MIIVGSAVKEMVDFSDTVNKSTRLLNECYVKLIEVEVEIIAYLIHLILHRVIGIITI